MAEVTDGRRVIQAREILDKIQKGEPVKYDDVIIEGYLDASKLTLPKENGIEVINSTINITNSKIEGLVSFNNIRFNDSVNFKSTHFKEDVSFREAVFKGSLEKRVKNSLEIKILETRFYEAIFSGKVDFFGAELEGDTNFNDVRFSGAAIFWDVGFGKDAKFERATFGNDADFVGTIFNGTANFSDATFFGNANFVDITFRQDARFVGTMFSKDAPFQPLKFKGKYLTFKGAKFKNADEQERVCKLAKKVLEEIGDKDESDDNFYLEMDAKRRLKCWVLRFPELLFVQWIFGYGVHPFRLMFCWFMMVTIFAIIYWKMEGIQSKFLIDTVPMLISNYTDLIAYKSNVYFIESFYFSVVTAATPGYGRYEPNSWMSQVIATIEALLGTFMWAAFITTFARKFSR